MRIKRLLPYLLCLGLWPAGIFAQERMHAFVATSLWWLMHEAGATSLSRSMFNLDAWLPLAFLDGFLVGFVPIHRLANLVTASLARFRSKPMPAHPNEMNYTRPVFWAWVLPTLWFLVRLITWNRPNDSSVLGARGYAYSESSFQHFFGLPTSYNLSVDTLPWFYDRLFVTSPMLFLMAYPAAVWLRHKLRLPTHEAASVNLERPSDADTLGS